MKIYKLIELSQGSDYHGAYHHINDDIVAICASPLAAKQHIDVLLQAEYDRDIAFWAEHPDGYKPELKGNTIWLTEEFNGLVGRDWERFIIEEEELILEDKSF